MKTLYLHVNPKLGTLFASHETLVLETQFLVQFSIIFALSPFVILSCLSSYLPFLEWLVFSFICEHFSFGYWFFFMVIAT